MSYPEKTMLQKDRVKKRQNAEWVKNREKKERKRERKREYLVTIYYVHFGFKET